MHIWPIIPDVAKTSTQLDFRSDPSRRIDRSDQHRLRSAARHPRPSDPTIKASSLGNVNTRHRMTITPFVALMAVCISASTAALVGCASDPQTSATAQPEVRAIHCGACHILRRRIIPKPLRRLPRPKRRWLGDWAHPSSTASTKSATIPTSPSTTQSTKASPHTTGTSETCRRYPTSSPPKVDAIICHVRDLQRAERHRRRRAPAERFEPQRSLLGTLKAKDATNFRGNDRNASTS